MKIGITSLLLTASLILEATKGEQSPFKDQVRTSSVTLTESARLEDAFISTLITPKMNRMKRSFDLGSLFDFDKVSSVRGGGYSGYASYPYPSIYGGSGPVGYTSGAISSLFAPLHNKLAIGVSPYNYYNRYRYYGGSPGFYSPFYASRGFGFHR